MKQIVLFFLLSCSAGIALGQLPRIPQLPPSASSTSIIDSILRANDIRSRQKIRSYASVINGFYTQNGLFTVHTKGDTVYFEIPRTLLHRDIMVINRLKKGPGGFDFFAGEELDEKTIQFEKGADSSICIRYDIVISEADSSDAIYRAVVNSNNNPVVASFPIKAYGKDSASYVIDVTKFLKGTEENNFVNSMSSGNKFKSTFGVLRDFYIESIHTYPINVEISIGKNTTARKGINSSNPEGPVTLITHSSFIALPEKPLQRRYFDQRVGYFADYYYAFGDRQQKSEKRKFILHWRLEPKPEDRDKWQRGELVEPAKPIVLYIDPATPKQWRKYLILGITDWQKAFEQAGFKNAIIGKEWPENDTTMHMDDARYSFINYFPSETENAYGPQVHDPRSGEIIQTHIGWYHNVMQLLHDWYMIQAAAVDPQARAPKFSEELMGQLIRFVSSHEVGHTLGLRHNFGSSSRTPVDSLRSKTWLKKHGHTSSIMDYARFNYVAQPEDHIPQEDLFPRIGEYDRWAIEWGYRLSNAANADEDKKIVNRWITDRLAKNPLLWFGDGESKKVDPRCQTEDLGDNAAKASAYGIKNLQRILPHLPEWTHEEGGIYEGLEQAYAALKSQYMRYMGHVLKNITGAWITTRSEDQPGEVYAIAPKARQKESLVFFNQQLFTTPYWLLNRAVADKAAEPESPDFVQDLQIKMVNSLLDTKQMNLLLGNALRFGPDKSLGIDEYIGTIHEGIWNELEGGGPLKIDAYRRNLQKSYIANLSDLMFSANPEEIETDVYSVARADLGILKRQVARALPKAADALTRYHLEDITARIRKALAIKSD